MKKVKTPFKDTGLFIKEINSFLNANQSKFNMHAKRTSDYFEMSSYNAIVQYYKNKGFKVKVKNLKNNAFRYKLSPSGNPDNFSFFEVIKTYNYKKSTKIFKYEIHHNLGVQSAHDNEIYTTPDISVIKNESIEKDNNHYLGNKNYSYIKNENLITFFEIKNYTPFPELMFNFIGILNELKPDCFHNKVKMKKPYHLAPSLLISGTGNFHTFKIKENLCNRYRINIFFSLFVYKSQIYSKKNSNNII